jgi:hypothetical protein
MEGLLTIRQDFPDGYIIQDNNLLQAPREHLLDVFAMLDRQPRAMVLAGGIQSSLVDDWFAEQLRGRRVNQIFMAADTKAALKPLQKAVDKLAFLGRRRIRSYVLIGFNGETLTGARERLEAVWEIGAMPFAQLYQPPDGYIHYGPDWRALQKQWCRPAAMVASHRRNEARHEHCLSAETLPLSLASLQDWDDPPLAAPLIGRLIRASGLDQEHDPAAIFFL